VTAADDPSRDPGWPSVGVFFALLIPGMLQREARRSRGDGLYSGRMVFISFFNAVILIGVVLQFMQLDGSGMAWPWLVALGVAAIASIVVTNLVDRPLDCTSAKTLAATYRTRFFLRIAFAETVALLGFVFSFTSQTAWIYYPAAAFTLYRFWTVAAPTQRALVADQRQLKSRGCQLSLVAALRTVPPPTRRDG
jgi:F0F1-type ATP synthase membrane subunit c/vacuolar-type H+-ATPase subunit K